MIQREYKISGVTSQECFSRFLFKAFVKKFN